MHLNLRFACLQLLLAKKIQMVSMLVATLLFAITWCDGSLLVYA